MPSRFIRRRSLPWPLRGPRLAKFSFAKTCLLKPRQSPAAVCIKIAFLFGQNFVKSLVDEG
jgi:hypothetical protein